MRSGANSYDAALGILERRDPKDREKAIIADFIFRTRKNPNAITVRVLTRPDLHDLACLNAGEEKRPNLVKKAVEIAGDEIKSEFNAAISTLDFPSKDYDTLMKDWTQAAALYKLAKDDAGNKGTVVRTVEEAYIYLQEHHPQRAKMLQQIYDVMAYIRKQPALNDAMYALGHKEESVAALNAYKKHIDQYPDGFADR
jgi:hypothetical protein